MRRNTFIILLLNALCLASTAQTPVKGSFVEYKAGYFENSVLKDNRAFDEHQATPEIHKAFRADFTGLEVPNKLDKYKQISFYFPPVSQGNTGTCWSFSTTSFYESEVYRITGQKIRISELFTVYWEYVERARRFVQQRGNSLVDQGSEGNAVTRIYDKYGAVPLEAYSGLINGRKHHNHEPMLAEILAYLNSVKIANAWNEEEVVSTVKSILNFHMGVPPENFTWAGAACTPKKFLNEVLKLKPDEYVEILSIKQEPYWQKVEYKVPDNWWHNKDYYNVPLDTYMEIIKNAIRKGYSMSIGGDVSEPGLNRDLQVAVIPSFDIPSEFINEDARQFRFSNQTTTDDHGMHLVGYQVLNGKDWYLIKDSSAGSRNNLETAPEFGFYFFSEDYVKLKMMGITIHRSAVEETLKKFK